MAVFASNAKINFIWQRGSAQRKKCQRMLILAFDVIAQQPLVHSSVSRISYCTILAFPEHSALV